MFIYTTWALRLSGLAGLLGAVLFITGDLLYNHIPGSSDSPTVKMGSLTDRRLLAAGMLGLPGCWLYALASAHIYLAFRPAGEIFAFTLLLVFGSVMISYGISHAAYFAIGAGARAAAQAGSDVEVGGNLGKRFFQQMVNIIYIPVAVCSLMMLYAILAGKSLYPIWIIIFLPITTYLLKTPLLKLLSTRPHEIINDCYDNFILFIFFLISTSILWNAVIS